MRYIPYSCGIYETQTFIDGTTIFVQRMLFCHFRGCIIEHTNMIYLLFVLLSIRRYEVSYNVILIINNVLYSHWFENAKKTKQLKTYKKHENSDVKKKKNMNPYE